MASEDELIALRKCEREDCEYRIPNGVKDLKDILMAMANHLAAIHPASGGQKEGVGASLMHPIPSSRRIFRRFHGLLGGTDLTGGNCLARSQIRPLRTGYLRQFQILWRIRSVWGWLVTKIRKRY